MLSFDTAPANVLACRLSGVATRDDILAMEEAVAGPLAENRRIGLVLDASEFSDITPDALAEDLKFELGLITKWNRFPRIALVTDKQWVQAIVDFCNPIVSAVEMRIFAPGEREAALAFAADLPAEAAPGRPSVRVLESPDPAVFAFEIDGPLGVADMEAFEPAMREAFAGEGRIDALARIVNFAGCDPALFTRRSLMALKMQALGKIRRYAVVGASGWMQRLIAWAGAMLPVEVKSFPADAEDEAWKWLRA